jgi:hypothetical protein
MFGQLIWLAHVGYIVLVTRDTELPALAHEFACGKMVAHLVKLTLLDAFAATERLRPVRADPARVLWQSVDLEAFKPSDKIFEDNFEELLAFVTQWPDHLPSTPDMCCGFSACNDVAQLVPLSHMCKEHRQWVSVNVRILKSLYYHLRRRVAKNGCKSRIACLRICVVPLVMN